MNNEFPVREVGHELQLVAAVWAGNGKAWVLEFPDSRGEVARSELLVKDLSQGQWQAVLRQSDLVETEVLTRAADGNLVKTILRKSERAIAQQVSWDVFRRDGYGCRYCGNDQVPLTVDHLVLWEHGGPSTPENLVSACRKCNKTRGRLAYADWLRSEHYLRVSRALSPEQRAANEALTATLQSIPRLTHVRSR